MAKPSPSKSRLGRGLSSLMTLSEPVYVELPQSVAATNAPAIAPDNSISPVQPTSASAPGVSVLNVALEQISANPHQPRRSFDEAALKELADSMATAGLIQPVVARAVGDGRYELIAGERRWRAAKLAGLASVPVIIKDVDSVLQAQMALIENVQREDLNAIDRAEAYQTLARQLGLTHAELAGRLGEPRSTVTNYVRLLDLALPVRELVQNGALSVGHGKLLAGVTDAIEQLRLAQLCVAQELSVRNLERSIAQVVEPPTAHPTPPSPSAHFQQLERSISRQLGLKVNLRAGASSGKGRLILHYSSLDQFDELMVRMGVDADA